MKAKSKVIRIATSYLFVMFILGEMFATASTTGEVPDKTIATKRIGSGFIMLTNDTGKLTPGENHFCVLFQNRGPTPIVDIREVSVDFRFIIGRMQGKAIPARLIQDGTGRYCGDINLGPQYYHPAGYYAFVRYVETTGKKKTARLVVTVK